MLPLAAAAAAAAIGGAGATGGFLGGIGAIATGAISLVGDLLGKGKPGQSNVQTSMPIDRSFQNYLNSIMTQQQSNLTGGFGISGNLAGGNQAAGVNAKGFLEGFLSGLLQFAMSPIGLVLIIGGIILFSKKKGKR